MTIPEIIIIIIFSVSLLANILYVPFNRQMGRYTNRWDLFRWISSYQLFADTPRDLRLFYRDKLTDGSFTDWREIPLFASRSWFHFIFFPEKLVFWSINSLVDDLVGLQKVTGRPQLIPQSFVYRTILRYIRRFPFAAGTVARQFKIEETGGFLLPHKKRRLFVSEFHDKCTFYSK